MEIGAEISQKIRAAIKTKLVDLGAYVDDELPDYIMVMIANKKSQEQMADDLSLFLGSNTDKFTKWLHSVLQKLQSATLESAALQTVPPANTGEMHSSAAQKTSSQAASKTRSLQAAPHSQSQQTGVDTWPRHATADAKSLQVAQSRQSHSTDTMLTHSVFDTQSQRVPKTKPTATAVQDAAPMSAQQQSILSVASPAASPEPEEAIISLKPETHDPIDEELRSEVLVGDIVAPVRKAPVRQATVTPSKPRPQSISVISSRVTSPSKGKTVSKVQPVARKRKSPGSVIGQVLSHDDDEDDDQGNLRGRMGGVASVVRISERRSSLPPAKQASRALVLKAMNEAANSVSRVSVRPRIQQLQQSNRALLLKTVHDAQDTLSQRPVSGKLVQVVSRVEPSHTAITSASTATLTTRGVAGRKATVVPTQQRQRRLPTTVLGRQFVPTVLDDEVGMEDVEEDVEEEEDEEDQESEGKEEANEGQFEVQEVEQVEEEEEEEEEEEVEIFATGKHVEYIVLEPEDTTPSVDRRASVESPVVSQIPRRAEIKRVATESKPPTRILEIQQRGRHLGDQRVFQNMDLQQIEEVMTPVETAVMKNEPSVQVVSHKMAPHQRLVQHTYIERPRPVSPKFIVTLDGVDPPKPKKKVRSRRRRQHIPMRVDVGINQQLDPALDDEGVGDEIDDDKEEEGEEEEEMVYVERDIDDEDEDDFDREEDDAVEYMEESCVRKRRPAVQPIIVHKLLQSDDEEMPSSDTSPPKRQKMVERCKFWPTCKSGDQCQYHHPNVPCKAFPRCRYGEKCLYIHPNCKYDARCAKPDCPFTHASKRQGALLPPPAPPPSPVIQPIGVHFPLSSPALPPHQVICRFFPNNCKKMNCPYLHPKLCRFGTNCSRDDCRFSHPKVASGAALKWVRPTSSKPS